MNRGVSTDGKQLCANISELDHRRNQSFKETFPEMALLLGIE